MKHYLFYSFNPVCMCLRMHFYCTVRKHHAFCKLCIKGVVNYYSIRLVMHRTHEQLSKGGFSSICYFLY